MAGTSSGFGAVYRSRCSLPSAWETRVTGIRNQQALQYLKVDGARVRYVGPGEDDSQAATIRANYPLPSDCPLYYFEVKILDKGQEGYIGVGFCTEEVSLCRLPGWDLHSYGYHGDDGHAFAGSGSGRPYGPPFTRGDVVGALYDKAERTISYFKNGEPLGVAFRDVQEASPVYPCVGLRTRGEELVANFGSGPSSEPFRTDFAALRAAFQRRILASVRKTELPLLSSRGTALLPQLMYDYLMHQRFWRTAAVLGRDLLRSEGRLDERELSDITVRQQSYDLVAAGRIDDALELLRDKYPPELLSERPSLDFRLRLQKFVQMVAAAHAAGGATAGAGARTGDDGAATSGAEQAADATAADAPSSSKSFPGGSRSAGISGAAASSADAGVGAEAGVDVGRPSPMETSEEDGAAAAGGGAEPTDSAAGPSGRKGAEAEPAAGAVAAAAAVPTTREILAYGTIELWSRCRTPADRELLTDALSLLAFTDPAASPAGEMLRPAHRIALAEELNGAMLACRGLPATSPLERIYQQASAVMSQLKLYDNPQALALPDARQLVMEPPALAAGSGGAPDGNASDAMTA